MNEQPTFNPLDELLPSIAQGVEEWRAEHTPEKLQKKVKDLLDKSSEEIVLKLLGFDKDTWDGKWSLDHCNGRSGDSSAGDYLRSAQANAIKEWFSTVELPKISPTLQKQLQREYASEFKQALQRKVSELARANATAQAAEVLAHLTQSSQIANYLKMSSLINTKGE